MKRYKHIDLSLRLSNNAKIIFFYYCPLNFRH